MGTFIDLTGQRFGKLVALERGPDRICGNRKIVTWKCQCDCGKIVFTRSDGLRNGTSKSCGCGRIGKRLIDEIGNKYGKLTVIERVGADSDHKATWLCKCDCGGTVITTGKRLRNGACTSCGCNTSVGNLLVSNYLTKNNIKYKKEYTFNDLLSDKKARLRFDFGIFNRNNELVGLCEYNGEQHYIDKGNGFYTKENLSILHKHDERKNAYCKEHNIPLLIIRYDEDLESKLDSWLEEIHVR